MLNIPHRIKPMCPVDGCGIPAPVPTHVLLAPLNYISLHFSISNCCFKLSIVSCKLVSLVRLGLWAMARRSAAHSSPLFSVSHCMNSNGDLWALHVDSRSEERRV